MQVGLMAPQGWKGEYDGWDPADAWARTIELAEQAEALGFESLWVFDHFHTVPQPTDEITFESFTVLSALAMATQRVRLGHMVICTGFRNPALTAKLSSTIDVISGGRFELGIGAGWKEDEWRAYGYGFPPIGERMGALGDHLEVISRMLGPGRATYEGSYAHVRGAINVPKGIQQPRIPIIVGGNGERRTAGYAIRFADELNYVFLEPDEIPERMARSARAARRRAATLRRCGSRSTSATRTCATPGRRGSTCSAASPRSGSIGSSLPDALVADRRGAGGVRRGLPGGRPHARPLTVSGTAASPPFEHRFFPEGLCSRRGSSPGLMAIRPIICVFRGGRRGAPVSAPVTVRMY